MTTGNDKLKMIDDKWEIILKYKIFDELNLNTILNI